MLPGAIDQGRDVGGGVVMGSLLPGINGGTSCVVVVMGGSLPGMIGYDGQRRLW